MLWEYLIAICITPMLLVAFGYYWQLRPPKKINWFYGYRTRRSMANQQIWDFANKVGAEMLIRVGIVTLAISILCYFLLPESAGIVISFFIFIIGIGVGMYWCETKINRYFDKNGNPK
ncbi:SdpI family protein [Sediminicola sp. YIK13]|uniref:SdpI family protein n=1 Tax=Sediminicola sp. YIK13 TaxID=1453352 RepID=UPI00078336B9|nr:SdpI family protein [Sediminicola sp. YIK13]